MSGYIGVQPVPQATIIRDTFIATAGQTSFATSGYTPGFVDVYINGVKLIDGIDFYAGNGSDIILTTGAVVGDNLEVLIFTTFEVSGYPLGTGFYKGNNGTNGDPVYGAGDIFRINSQTLLSNVTIGSTENASLTGPLTIDDGITLTVDGNLSVL